MENIFIVQFFQIKFEVRLKVGIESIQAQQLDNNFKVSNYSNIGNSAQFATRSQTTNWPGLSYPILSDRQYDSERKVGRCSSLHSVHLQDSVSVVLRTKGKRSASSTHGIFQRRCGIRYCKYIHFLLRFSFFFLLHLLTGTTNKPEIIYDSKTKETNLW